MDIVSHSEVGDMFSATVLVIEDELLVRHTISDYLRANGFEVVEAADVEAALGLLRSGRINIIFPTSGSQAVRPASTWRGSSGRDGQRSRCCSPAAFTTLKTKCLPV